MLKKLMNLMEQFQLERLNATIVINKPYFIFDFMFKKK